LDISIEYCVLNTIKVFIELLNHFFSKMTQVNVRFLLFPSGKEFSRKFSIDTYFKDMNKIVFEEWPTYLQPIHSIEEIRMIHSGKIIEENKTVREVFNISVGDHEPSVTVHIAIKRKPIPVPSTQEAPKEQNMETEEDIHFHFCTVDEEEAGMMNSIFDRKKGEDGKISVEEAEKFLKIFWQWMRKNNIKGSNEEFPARELQSIKLNLIGSSERINCDQFRQIFYLFDNNSFSSQACPHGEKERVKVAVQHLHTSTRSDLPFATQVFENVFSSLDRDSDGILSCREVELLYYTYSTHIMCDQEAL